MIHNSSIEQSRLFHQRDTRRIHDQYQQQQHNSSNYSRNDNLEKSKSSPWLPRLDSTKPRYDGYADTSRSSGPAFNYDHHNLNSPPKNVRNESDEYSQFFGRSNNSKDPFHSARGYRSIDRLHYEEEEDNQHHRRSKRDSSRMSKKNRQANSQPALQPPPSSSLVTSRTKHAKSSRKKNKEKTVNY